MSVSAFEYISVGWSVSSLSFESDICGCYLCVSMFQSLDDWDSVSFCVSVGLDVIMHTGFSMLVLCTYVSLILGGSVIHVSLCMWVFSVCLASESPSFLSLPQLCVEGFRCVYVHQLSLALKLPALRSLPLFLCLT